MPKKLLAIRYVYWIAVAFTLINSVVFLLSGIRQSLEGYLGVYRYLGGEPFGNQRLPLLESLDSFLVALVFLIFSLGIMKIFIGYRGLDESLPPWLRIHDFKELKVLLWESILVTLVVMAMGTVARNINSLTWDSLVLPAIVLVLAVGLYLMRGKET
ncbi:MAG TPA: YqhA family protein [Candidatus Methylomirabilis sp.]|nr:YqhA family protein [Candidatus Methylomirabilis sp.]